MLNWHRDPDYERRMSALRSETERLRRENMRLAELNSRMHALLLSADSCSSTPPETDCN
jgi:hypothetical protein